MHIAGGADRPAPQIALVNREGRYQLATPGLGAPLEPSPATAAAVRALRAAGVEGPGPDRYLAPEIEVAVGLVASGAVLDAVEEVIGELA